MAEIIKIDLGLNNPTEFVDALDKMHRSKGYTIIKDHMSQKMLKAVREDVKLYQRFQDIKAECKKSFEYDKKVPTMLDVNKGLTNLYNIILRLFKSYKSGNDETLNEICQAINRIEEKLDMEQTDWTGGTNNATSDTGNGEGISPSNK